MSNQQERRNLIHEGDRDWINEGLYRRGVGDAGRSVGFGFLGYGIVAGTIALAVFTNLLPPKFIVAGLLIGACVSWLSSNGNVHLNNPNDLK